MKNCFFLWTLLLALAVVSSCDEVWVGPESINTPKTNFDLFWQAFDRHYAYFSIKEVDWDSVYQAYQPRIHPNMTDEELFAILTEIGRLLQDGHYYVVSNDLTLSFSYFGASPRNAIPTHPFPAISYLEEEKQINSFISYARVRDTDVGYLRITSFEGELEDYQTIDAIIDALAGTRALIVDARTTRGGDTDLAKVIASRFANQPHEYRRYKYRNGPNRDEFTDWITDVVVPEGEGHYPHPVVVLTDRRCFSACEGFVLMMQALPDVVTLGDTTFGGTARAVWQELPNGWSYRVSTWFVVQPDGQVVEGRGIAPDISAPYVQVDSFDIQDNAMDRAIELLGEIG